MSASALERAVAVAKANQQFAMWDRAERPWAIALYDSVTKQLLALSDEEAAMLLTRDSGIAREWRRWNAMSGSEGSLIVLDMERARKVLTQQDKATDDEMEGLA